MVAIHPFRALRYDPGAVGDLSRVLAPPYDVISPEEQDALYRASPYNVVRLILGTQDPSDTPDNNRYTRARRDFTAWRREGILRADEEAAIYLVEHVFHDGPGEDRQPRTRLGFVALFDLGEGIERSVYRHEATLAAPKEDRTKLLDALPANLEPIFCVYPDEGGVIQALLERQRRRSPTAQAEFKGELVRIWALTDAQVIEELGRRLGAAAVLIADGHHRFEVALANRKRYGALMSYFVSMADPSLVVRPIHRVVRQDRAFDRARVETVCTVEPAEDLASAMRWLQRQEGEGRFAAYDGRAFFTVTVNRDSLARWLRASTVPTAMATLDVAMLHGLILPSLCLNGAGVRYTADASQALRMVSEAQGAAAWFLRPIALAQVYALASQGCVLPPKSTYFYPKIPSGLTINPLI